MNKKILVIGIAVIFLNVVLIGCQEESTNNSQNEDNSNDTDDNNTTFISPSIISFSVNPYSIDFGGTAELEWVVSNAESVSIDNGIGYVSFTGIRVVSPTITTTYTITARNGDKEMNATTVLIVNQIVYNTLLVGTWNLIVTVGDSSYDRYVFNADKTGLFGQTDSQGQLTTWQGIDKWVVEDNTVTITENFNPDQPMTWSLNYDGNYLTLTNIIFPSISGKYEKI